MSEGCVWPVRPMNDAAWACGEPVLAEQPYCAEHAGLCLTMSALRPGAKAGGGEWRKKPGERSVLGLR